MNDYRNNYEAERNDIESTGAKLTGAAKDMAHKVAGAAKEGYEGMKEGYETAAKDADRENGNTKYNRDRS